MFQDMIKYLKREKAICKYCGVFSVDLRIMKKRAAKCQDNQLKHPKLVEKSFFKRDT